MATSASTPINPPVPVASNTVVLTADQLLTLQGINNNRIKNGEDPFLASDPAAIEAVAKFEAFVAAETAPAVVPPNTVAAPTVTPAVDPVVVPTPTDTVVFTAEQQVLLDKFNQTRISLGQDPLASTDPEAESAVNTMQRMMNDPIIAPVPTDTVVPGVNEVGYDANGVAFRTVDMAGTNIPPTVLPPLPMNNMNDVTGDSGLGVNTLFSAAASGLFGKTAQKVATSGGVKDWRFRMSLAPSANYMYKAMNPGILTPLKATNGVIFPYSPQISVSYTANYSNYDLTHSNFKIHTYKNSSVENVTITGDFTAQDTTEANYLLAVMHFFKSVTKMFYGQDQNPQRGIPPPLLYLSGFGQYQFDMHPVVVTSYTHTFPTDVDYINAYPTNPTIAIGGLNLVPFLLPGAGLDSAGRLRQLASTILPGGMVPPPAFNMTQNINQSTRVPTKVQIQLQCLPVVTRNLISNKFSLREYSNGSLMKGSTNGTGGGIW